MRKSLKRWASTVATCLAPPGTPAVERLVMSHFDRDPTRAVQAFRHLSSVGKVASTDSAVAEAMVERACAFGYLSWPKRLQRRVEGRDVLDVGCGTGLHAIGFALMGVRSYAGLDPKVRLDADRAKNTRLGRWEPFGWTPAEMMRVFPQIRLIQGSFEAMAPDDLFDVAVLHNATEHIIALDEVLAGIARRLRPDGRLIYNHHNFYCWNGHHMAPKTVQDLRPEDADQRKFVDWAHLRFEPPPGHYFHHGLNRIRLDELRRVTERHFTVESWKEVPTDEVRGADRLTPELLAQHPGYSRRELATQHVFCVAQPRAQARLAA